MEKIFIHQTFLIPTILCPGSISVIRPRDKRIPMRNMFQDFFDVYMCRLIAPPGCCYFFLQAAQEPAIIWVAAVTGS
jgi:hypothetical protein